MPIVDLAPQPITGEMGLQPVESLENAPAYITGASRDYGMDYSASPQAERPSVLGAAGRQSSEIISPFSRRDIGVSNDIEEGYGSAWNNIKGTKYEQHWRSFVDVNNSRMEAARKAQIDMEEDDRRTLAAAGIWGDLASMGMSMFSPTILAPGGSLIRAIKGGYSVSRSALNIGMFAAVGVGAQEAVLQGTQELRPWEESAIAVGGGFVLGGLLGAGAAKFLTRAEQRLAERGYRTLQQAMAPDAARAGSAVAAPLADLAARMKAGEDVPVQEAIEAARVAALQARQTDMNAERLARIDDVIEPMVRRLEQTASASTADELLVATRTSFGADGARLVDEGAVTIVQSVEDLPARPDGQAHPSDVRGVFDGNKAYIVADNVAPDEVKGVLLHEVGVHFGMQRMVGDANFRTLLEDVVNRANQGEARFAEALAQVPRDTPTQHVAEEVLAYLVENAPELGIVQRVVAAVKQFIRQAFGGRFTGLSEGEIRQLAVASLRKWNKDAKPAEVRQPRYSRTQTDTPAFKKWSDNAPLITAEAAQTHQFKTGEKIVVEAFHGTKRPDRVGTKFLKKRATSGPMAYHTSSPELASSYAMQKADTSLAYEDTDYANWFKFKPPGSRSTVGIDRAWFFLTPEQKQKVFDLAPRVMQDDDLNIVLGPEGHKSGAGGFDYHLAETRTSWDRRGNPLKALVEEWLNSGNLINDEGKFLDVLEKAGFPIRDVNYDAPNAEFPAVYKNYIAMRNPLVTSDVPDTVVRALEDAAKTDRSRAQRGGADLWDKNTRTLREWVKMFKEPDNAYVWTSIPDKVTDVFKRLGYDGIVDWSGKGGGERAPVYVPFEETQVKSALGNRGTFDPNKNDIRYSRGGNRKAQIADQLEALSRALASVDDAEAFARTFAGRGAAAGAEFTDQPSLEDLTIAGKGARAYAAATRFMNPNLRANFRASASARADMQRLLENTIFQQMHLDNQTLGPAVETQMRAEYRARIIASAQAADNIWQEARKAGLPMTRRQFDEAVARAMRREDVGENDFVTRAAQSYRKEMFDHFKVMAQNTRGSDGKPLLPEDLQVVGAPSYLTRMPNYERLTTDEMGFKSVVAKYYEGVFRNEYQKAADATRARITALEQEIADLRMSPEDRVQTLDAIDKRLAEMETMNAREVDLLAEINRFRQQATKAAESGNKKAAQAAREEASRLFASGGDTLREFLKERSALRSRQRRVDLNYAGLQEREDRIMQQLADIDDANLRAMNRLIDRGMKAERDMAKLDPAQKVEKIAELRSQFADVVARSEKAAQRLSDMSRKIVEGEIAALQKAIKERQAGGMREALADTAVAKQEAKSREANKALAEAIKRNAAAEAKRTEELSRIARRLDEAEALDPDGQILELKRAMNELAAQASNASLGRGEKAQRLMDRAKKLDPQALDKRIDAIKEMRRDIEQEFYRRWGVERGGEGVDLDIANAKPRFNEYAQDVARQIFDHYTGRSENSGTVPDFAVPLATGPLKERTFNIPDQLIEPWLENDIGRIAERYARTMAAQIELTRKFGRADMRDQFARMAQEYRDLREQVGLAKNADEALQIVGQRPGTLDAFNAWRRKEDVNTVTKERILQWLSKDEDEAARDMRAGRDLLLGRYKMEENQGDWGTISRGLLAFNYIRAMGGAVIANLGDLYRSAMVHGLGRFMSEGIKPLVTNLEGFRASVKEAQLAGQVGEAWLHQRLATFAEIGDPYGKGNAVERLMENASRVASKWNGLQMFTDFSKSIASVTSQGRIMDAVLAGKDQKYLRFLGIDSFMEGRIKEQVRAHSKMIDGIRVAETERWTDEEAVRAYRAALSKDVDSITVERSVGDVPLFANTPTGRLILQFRTYNLAANQRVLLRGLQEDQARFVGSIVALTSIGMLVSALRSWRGGEERWDKFKQSANNPGYLIGEGLDMSGIFTIPFEVANTVEKLTQPSGFSFNPIKTPMMAAFPGRSQQGESTRFASRDPIGALLGPSAGLPMTAAKALGGDFKAASQLIPFGTYPGMREALQAISGDSPYGF